MKLMNMHSFVDIITNSSTVIYTYQDGSVAPAKELLQELMILSGVSGNVEDLFFVDVFQGSDGYTNYLECMDEDEMTDEMKVIMELGWREQSEAIDNIIEQILCGDITKPEWMENAEGRDDYDERQQDTMLHIKAKDNKYDPFVKKMITFLNSSESEESYDG